MDVQFFACDLTREKERCDLALNVSNKCKELERIINVAGVDTQMPFLDYSEQKLLFQLRVNTESVIHITHLLLKLGKVKEIITIGSMSCVSPMPYFAIYSATKALLLNFFTALHYELKGFGVKVTTVLPGGVYTRPDVIKEIESQGIYGKLSAKSPDFVAKKSLKAVQKNKIKYIPGFFNKALYCIMKIAPKRWVLTYISRRWKKHKKDAF